VAAILPVERLRHVGFSPGRGPCCGSALRPDRGHGLRGRRRRPARACACVARHAPRKVRASGPGL